MLNELVKATRCVCLFLLTCGANNVLAQALEGGFITRFTGGSNLVFDTFQFKGNQFIYQQSTCTGTLEGSGTYVIRADSVLLYFKQPGKSSLVESKPCLSSGLAPTYCFKVVDRDTNEAIPGATLISVKNSGIGVGANNLGEANLTYSPPASDSICINSTGYRTMYVPLPPAGSQGYVVSMGPAGYIDAGTVLSFPVSRARAGLFVLKPEHYQRISNRKARARIGPRYPELR